MKEYLQSLTRHRVFGSNFPIPSMRDPTLKISENYVRLAGFTINEDIDVDPEEEEDVTL